MMMILLILLVSLLSLISCKENEIVHSRLVPTGWELVVGRAVPADQDISFRVNLVQNNVAGLAARTRDAADPTSANYGQWLSRDEVREWVRPAAAQVAAVVHWLRAAGVRQADAESLGDAVVCRAPAAAVERVFRTKLAWWRHPESGAEQVGALAVRFPARFAGVIELVSGLMEFWPKPRRRGPAMVPLDPAATLQHGVGNDVSAGYIIPDTLRRLYQIPRDDFRAVSAKSSVCTAEFSDYTSFSKPDLHQFDQGTGELNTHVDHIVGPYDGAQNPGLESQLDIEYASAISLNSSLWFWTAKNWMLEWTGEVFAHPKPLPLVFSISWGWPEPQQCQVVMGGCQGLTSQEYVERVSKEFLKLTSTGISFFASSGDQGAPGDGNPRCFNKQQPLSTLFPCASEWVTCVGATMLKPVPPTPQPPTAAPQPTPPAAPTPALPPTFAQHPAAAAVDSPPAQHTPPVCRPPSQYTCASGTDQEIVCSWPDALITSGGSFSDYVKRPAWQDKAVTGYLNNTSVKFPPFQYFNKHNRAFPDVSANGHAYLISAGGRFIQVDGTSCSSPVFAAITALLNGARLNAGKSSLGFFNPALYKMWEENPDHFHDITVGNNKATESCVAKYGFEAAPGWDATTGLGTPNFAKMLEYVMKLK